MEANDKENNFIETVNKLVSEEKFGEAINYLQKIIDSDSTNEQAATLLKHLKKILEYKNRDVFGSTNLNMDPWLE